MEFDRIIVRKTDADRINGAEQAVAAGRRAWCLKRIFRELKFRMNDQNFRAEFDFGQVNRQEGRYVDDFKREFNEEPLDILERRMEVFLDKIRR